MTEGQKSEPSASNFAFAEPGVLRRQAAGSRKGKLIRTSNNVGSPSDNDGSDIQLLGQRLTDENQASDHKRRRAKVGVQAALGPEDAVAEGQKKGWISIWQL